MGRIGTRQATSDDLRPQLVIGGNGVPSGRKSLGYEVTVSQRSDSYLFGPAARFLNFICCHPNLFVSRNVRRKGEYENAHS